MDNKKIEQNYEQILENETAKAEAGDALRKQLFEYVYLSVKSGKMAEEYKSILSSRDKEEASAVWCYFENKRTILEIDFLERKLALLQNKINKLSAKKQPDEMEIEKLQNYHGEFMLTETKLINLQKHRTRDEIERVNKAIKSYVNDASVLDASFEEIVKFIKALSKEEKKALISTYAKSGESFMLLNAADLTKLQSFGE
ncbi:MAG: hypothetical protein J6J33_04990 [Clostridia bacterium]|nr:hypothetical protein [Clostridia bacterium]